MQNFNINQPTLTAQALLQPFVPVVQMSLGQAAKNCPGIKTLLDFCDVFTRRAPEMVPLSGALINPGLITGEDYMTQHGAALFLKLPDAYEPMLARLLRNPPDIATCYGINSTRSEYSAIWSVRMPESSWEVRIAATTLEELINANRGSSDCGAVWVPVIFVAGSSLCVGGFWATNDWELSCSYNDYVVDDRDWDKALTLTDSETREAFPWRWNVWQSALGTRAFFAETFNWYSKIPYQMEMEMESDDTSSAQTAGEALLPVF